MDEPRDWLAEARRMVESGEGTPELAHVRELWDLLEEYRRALRGLGAATAADDRLRGRR